MLQLGIEMLMGAKEVIKYNKINGRSWFLASQMETYGNLWKHMLKIVEA